VPLDYPDPELSNDVVRLRRWALGDLACVEAASSDTRIPEGTTVPARYTHDEGRAWIERNLARQTKGQGLSQAIADPDTNEAMGLAYLGLEPVGGHCRLGYWVIPSARRRGLATNAVRLLSRWVLTHTEVYRLIAHVEMHNDASVAVLRQTGFTEEGIARSYIHQSDGTHDARQFSLLRSDLEERNPTGQ
jgi:RimJ/RimL family protein N-acetyltransferase